MANCHMFRISFTVLSTNANKIQIPNMLIISRTVPSPHQLICSASWWMTQAPRILNRGHTLFEVGNHLKTYISPILCSPKATFNISVLSIAFFPVYSNIQCWHVVTSSLQFSRYAKIIYGHNKPVLNKTLLNHHTCYSLIQKWMTQQTIPSLHLAVATGASSSITS